jgi:hypothetical protein
MKSPSLAVWLMVITLPATWLLAASACAPSPGNEGQPCKCSPIGTQNGCTYQCDPNLACNMASHVCEVPPTPSVPEGGVCGTCGPGQVCLEGTDGPVCREADAGLNAGFEGDGSTD